MSVAQVAIQRDKGRQVSYCTNAYFLPVQILVYNRANRAVAILCNHQRAVPKTHAKSMENLKAKIDAKKEMVQDAERQYKDAKHEHKRNGSAKNKM